MGPAHLPPTNDRKWSRLFRTVPPHLIAFGAGVILLMALMGALSVLGPAGKTGGGPEEWSPPSAPIATSLPLAPPPAPGLPSSPSPPPVASVRIDNGELLVDGATLYLWGVNWQPHVLGVRGHEIPASTAETLAASQAPQIRAAGFNAVKLYQLWNSTAIIDAFHNRGVYTVMGPIASGLSNETLRSVVDNLKSQRGLLLWTIGNEWNYNQLYNGAFTNDDAARTLTTYCEVIKAADPSRPVVSVFGDPTYFFDATSQGYYRNGALEACVDGWGFNMYRAQFSAGVYDGVSAFGGSLASYTDLDPRMFKFAGEFGMDAYDYANQREDQAAQANATRAMLTELFHARGWSGGFVFEWQDEWWKAGAVDAQDNTGWPQPDNLYSEDWWGLVKANDEPRQALFMYNQTKASLLSALSPPPSAPAVQECCGTCPENACADSPGAMDVADRVTAGGTCGDNLLWCVNDQSCSGYVWSEACRVVATQGGTSAECGACA